MIVDLHRQGLILTAIARRTGLDRKTVRKYIERGLEAPVYSPRPPKKPVIAPWRDYLWQRIQALPELTTKRLMREIRDLGYTGGHTAVKACVRSVRLTASPLFERRFETPPGRPAQVAFACFRATFADEPEAERVVWLMSPW